MASFIGESSTLDDVDEAELPDSLTVNELTPLESVTEDLSDLFEMYDRYDGEYIVGEVTDLSMHENDHLYFSVSSATTTAQLRCVVWEHNREMLPVDLKENMLVAACGTLSFYEGGGHPSLHVDELYLVGESAYWERIERLREEFAEEGLFNEARKQDLPAFPTSVALVTSVGSDAEQDTIESIHGRYPDVDIKVYETQVQGETASEQLVTAITQADASAADIVVVTRGGGSNVALRPFNDESVVRAVADATTPTVAAIGHDADTPLIDEVADVRVKTPTAVGEAVVRDKATIEERLETARRAITAAAETHMLSWLAEHRDSITAAYTAHTRQYWRTRRQAITTHADGLLADWLASRRATVTRQSRAHSLEWLDTQRTLVKYHSDRHLMAWLDEQRHAINTTYQQHVGTWIGESRRTVRQAVETAEREQIFQQQQANLEQRNTTLLIVVGVLLLIVLVLGAMVLGVI